MLYLQDPDLFPELLTELRIATADEEMTLDKIVTCVTPTAQ
jgi:hypothetical protein